MEYWMSFEDGPGSHRVKGAALHRVNPYDQPPKDGVFSHMPALMYAYPTKITIRVFPSASSCFSTVAAKPANFRVSTARLTEL